MSTKPIKETKPARETVTAIPVDQIQPFKDHPFRVEHDAAMERLIESIREKDVLTPAIVRPLESGGYEMISGHRRLMACQELGHKTIPAVIRKLDDDEAILQMVDANQQREELLPSEKAKAYKMRLEALLRQQKAVGHAVSQNDSSGKAAPASTVGHAVPQEDGDGKTRTKPNRTAAKVGEADGASYKTVERYIRLNELIPPLLKLVDEKEIKLGSAIELSYLPKKEQELLMTAIESEQSIPSRAQIKELRQKSNDGAFTADTPLQVLMSNKGKAPEKLTIPMAQVAKYFSKDATPAQMMQAIVSALEKERRRQRNRQQER